MVSLFGVAAPFSGEITTAYNFGKTVEQKFIACSPTPTPKVVALIPVSIVTSKSGTIKATYQIPDSTPAQTPTNTPTPAESESATVTVEPTAKPTPLPVLHYV